VSNARDDLCRPRRVGAQPLGAVALHGRREELQQLADTFDEILGRL
jgi:hypothetical protein